MSFFHVTHVIMNEVYYCPTDLSHAQVCDLSYHEFQSRADTPFHTLYHLSIRVFPSC
jgi:hypothetical protein